jgi:hypothetical protein
VIQLVECIRTKYNPKHIMTIKTTLAAVCSTALFLQAPLVFAQDATPAPDTAPSAAPSAAATPASPAPTGPGGGGNADFRQRMNDRMKAALKASDDEWAVIQPLLEKVQTAQRATMAGRFGGFGRRGGFGGPGGPGGNGGPGGPGGGNGPAAGASPGAAPANRPGRVDMPEADALRTALESDSTSPEEIKTKLQALRDARKKAAADLEQAREDLQKVLTLRQEAALVQMGILE